MPPKRKPKSPLSSPEKGLVPYNWHPFIQEALKLGAAAAKKDEVPVGAVVILKGEIVGRGYNLRETLNDPTAHAEILAIREACKNLESWRLSDATLIVTLEPCPMCLAACQQARVKRVIYAALDPKGGALSLGYTFHEDRRLNHRFQAQRIEDAECGKILSEFFKSKRKKSKI